MTHVDEAARALQSLGTLSISESAWLISEVRRLTAAAEWSAAVNHALDDRLTAYRDALIAHGIDLPAVGEFPAIPVTALLVPFLLTPTRNG